MGRLFIPSKRQVVTAAERHSIENQTLLVGGEGRRDELLRPARGAAIRSVNVCSRRSGIAGLLPSPCLRDISPNRQHAAEDQALLIGCAPWANVFQPLAGRRSIPPEGTDGLNAFVAKIRRCWSVSSLAGSRNIPSACADSPYIVRSMSRLRSIPTSLGQSFSSHYTSE